MSFLNEECEWEADLDGIPEELRDHIQNRRDRATQEFSCRNVLYCAHNLIRLQDNPDVANSLHFRIWS